MQQMLIDLHHAECYKFTSLFVFVGGKHTVNNTLVNVTADTDG